MATDTASRASLDVREMQSVAPEADVQRRKHTLEESMRKTAGNGAVAYYAAQNPAINTAMTHRNIDFVNDGEGGYRDAASIDEVLAYGTARRARVTREIKDGERHAVTVVGHLPMSMCEPDGTTYHPLDTTTGLPKDGKDGRPLVTLPRYRAKDEAEMRRYFSEFIDFQATNILPGGHDAIHGGSINLDESRPHVQLLVDTYEKDPRGKEPDALRNGFSRAFGRHRSDRKVQKVSKTGNPMVAADGSPIMVGEGARRKMERYHCELKSHMIDAGFDIEAERDAVRHDRRLVLPDYQEVQDLRTETAAQAAIVEEAEADLGLVAAGLVEERQALHEKAQALEIDVFGDVVSEVQAHEREVEKDLAARRAEVEQLRKKAESEGYEKGLARGTMRAAVEFEEVEAPSLRATARAEGRAAGEAESAKIREEAQEAAEQARRDERAARVAREEAEKRLAELPEYDPKVAVQEMQAIRHDAAERVRVVAIEKGAYRTDPTTGKAVIEPASAVIDRQAAALWDQRRAGKKGPMPTETVGMRAEKVRGIARGGQKDLAKANASAERSRSQSNDGMGR
ncbi:hypothetical protein [Gordonia sp. VNK21]|uniref:hypothetical protein n=1 Tax=Gordonia sp. VNK21 TaxID=3382483 RepID=UPI0038D35C08